MIGKADGLFKRLWDTEEASLAHSSLIATATHIKRYFERVYFDTVSPEYTWYESHGPEHTRDIMRNIDAVISVLPKREGGEYLTGAELFVLIASSYLQHVGLFGPLPPETDAQQEIERGGEERRYQHEKTRTAEAIQAIGDLFFLDDWRLVEAIETLCVAESYDRLLARGSGEIKRYLDASLWTERYQDDQVYLRPRLLYAVWSIAHILATSQKRLPDKVRQELLRGDRKEPFELNFWLRSYCISDVSIRLLAECQATIQFELLVPETNEWARREIHGKLLKVLCEGIDEMLDVLDRFYQACVDIKYTHTETHEPDLEELFDLYRNEGVDISLRPAQRQSGIEAVEVGEARSIVKKASSGMRLREREISRLRMLLYAIPHQPTEVRDPLVGILTDELPSLIEEGSLPRSALFDEARGGPVEIARELAQTTRYSSVAPIEIAVSLADKRNIDEVITILIIILTNTDDEAVRVCVLNRMRPLLSRFELRDSYYHEIYDATVGFRERIVPSKQATALSTLSDSVLAELYAHMPSHTQRVIEEQIMGDLKNPRFAPFRRELADSLALILYDAIESPNQEKLFRQLVEMLRNEQENIRVREGLVNNLVFLLPKLHNGQRRTVREVFGQLTDQGVPFSRFAMSTVLQRAGKTDQ